jgi:hypothetical protein
MPKQNKSLLLIPEIEERLSQPRQMVRYCLYKVQACARDHLCRQLHTAVTNKTVARWGV